MLNVIAFDFDRRALILFIGLACLLFGYVIAPLIRLSPYGMGL
jgi:hypothetical protein